MKQVVFILLLLLLTIRSFCQFGDTVSLRAFIRDSIRDKRPDKVTAAQLQRALLGVSQFLISDLDKVHTSDTSTMLSPYFRKADTVSLSNRINGIKTFYSTDDTITDYRTVYFNGKNLTFAADKDYSTYVEVQPYAVYIFGDSLRNRQANLFLADMNTGTGFSLNNYPTYGEIRYIGADANMRISRERNDFYVPTYMDSPFYTMYADSYISNIASSYSARSKVDKNYVDSSLTARIAPPGWSLTGNTGTTAGSNFIGTTDNVPLNFRVNNQKAGRIDNTLGSVFFGYLSGGSQSPFSITAIGDQALKSLTTGNYNTAVGSQALEYTTSGGSNVALGYSSLLSNTTGSNNVGVGGASLISVTTGIRNTGIGGGSGGDVSTGNYNVVVGYGSAAGLTTGSNNTIIGANVTGLSASLSNNIILADGQGNKRLQYDNSGNLTISAQSTVSDTTTYKPMVQDASGNVRKASQWYGANVLTFNNGLSVSGGNIQLGGDPGGSAGGLTSDRWLKLNGHDFTFKNTDANSVIFADDSTGGWAGFVKINNETILMQDYSNLYFAEIQPGFLELSDASGSSAPSILFVTNHSNGNIYLDPSDSTLVLRGTNINGIKLGSLAGSGTRMVVANSSGVISTQSVGQLQLTTGGSLLAIPVNGMIENASDKIYYTIPTGTARKEFTLNDAALTSGRIPFATTNGRLLDDQYFTWNNTTKSMIIGNTGVGNGTLIVNPQNSNISNGRTGVAFSVDGASYNNQTTGAGGTSGTSSTVYIDGGTYTATNTGVTAAGNAALYLVAPRNGTNFTQTRRWALQTDAGNGDVSIQGNMDVLQIRSNGSTPSRSAGTGAGTSPTTSVTGSDLAGTISVTAGSSPASSATLLTVTYSAAYASKPRVILTPANSAAAKLSGGSMVWVDDASSSSSSFILKSGTAALTATTQYIWYYHVIQ